MDTFNTAVNLITKNVFLTSIDIRDAYYGVKVSTADRKYLIFYFDNELYQFTCRPNGLASAPRKYTKLCKPVYSTLRKMGITIMGYIDDSLIVSDSEEESLQAVKSYVNLLKQLGFLINYNKSSLIPTQRIQFLRFIIDSVKMVIELPESKSNYLFD
ncbi:hypothetical protein SNE40_012400 [Patella caerulea]|uniref:Reverse transcriptase domain-containing protein n=1 Tax=Patella caerulea TaxID=87958 RepID=A0AAN8PQK1_PATCE